MGDTIQQQIVMPGDKIGVEEEFMPGDNATVDSDGTIRATIPGTVEIRDGKVSVHNSMREIRPLKRGMYILGTVTDDVKSVVFVKIDSLYSNGLEYLAMKDGKIVAPRQRNLGSRGPPRGRDSGGDRRGGGRFRDSGTGYGEGPPERELPKKSCGVGDAVLAKIAFDDPDIYTLAFFDPETGVVFAQCELCGARLETVEGSPNALKCPVCEHTESRKISTLYGQPEAIKKFLEK